MWVGEQGEGRSEVVGGEGWMPWRGSLMGSSLGMSRRVSCQATSLDGEGLVVSTNIIEDMRESLPLLSLRRTSMISSFSMLSSFPL